MQIIIASAGRWKSGPERSLYEHFARRINWKMELKEVEERIAKTPAGRREKEAERLLTAAGEKSFLIALDGQGKQADSRKFASLMQSWQAERAACLAFLIGGADGLDQSLLARVDYKLSLGDMTWPHLLVRVMLAEQIYRAQTIMAKHPYHRG